MARLQKIKVPTTEFIEDLAQEAARGNADALNELGRLNEKLGRTANQRLRDLEKKGYTSSEAYKQAQYRMNADRAIRRPIPEARGRSQNQRNRRRNS